MITPLLDHQLERSLVIRAARDTVFRYFTDSERFARWWGAGSHIDPKPGGALHVRYPNGVVMSGTVLEISPDERIVFSFGYPSGAPMPPESSHVTIRLEDHDLGTKVTLTHRLADPAVRDQFVQGWRYQLAVFATVVTGEQHSGIEQVTDNYFAAWNEPDAAARRARLAGVLDERVTFQDQFSCTNGLDDLNVHIDAARAHMPGLTLTRQGSPRHCQGTALVDWVAVGPDDAVRGRGTNVFTFGGDGKARAIVGFWNG